jgi:hypothetical protein
MSCSTSERRVRLTPRGIEIEEWRLINSITIPVSASSIPITSLISPGPDVRGAVPQARPASDDADTLEQPVEAPTTSASPGPAAVPDYDQIEVGPGSDREIS